MSRLFFTFCALFLLVGPASAAEPASPATFSRASAWPARFFGGAPARAERGLQLPSAILGTGKPSCDSRCGRDQTCRALCTAEIERAAADAQSSRLDEDQCLACGRETGFVPRPILDATLDGTLLTLTWSAVPDADEYLITAVRLKATDRQVDRSYEWVRTGNELRVILQTGYVYAFQVIPRRDGENLVDSASKTVYVEP